MEAVWSGQAHLAQGRSPYARHRPEETLLYRVIDDHYPDFLAQIETEGRTLPPSAAAAQLMQQGRAVRHRSTYR